MDDVQQDVRDIMALARFTSSEQMSDEVARALFREWKKDLDVSIGDLFRAVEMRGRLAASGSDE